MARIEQDAVWFPKFQAAKKRERTVRDFAMARLNHRVCGVEIRAMTLRDFALLSVVGNPFVCGGALTKEDAAQLLWLLSPSYVEPRGIVSGFRARRARGRILFVLAHFTEEALVEGVEEYLEEMFMDAPGGKSGRTETVSASASMVMLLQSEGKFGRDECMAMPLPELWQYVRAIQGGTPFNKFSDAVSRQWAATLSHG